MEIDRGKRRKGREMMGEDWGREGEVEGRGGREMEMDREGGREILRNEISGWV